MLRTVDCNSNISAKNRFTSQVLQHLMEPEMLRLLDAKERTQLESANWSVKTIAKGCSLIDQGEYPESIYILLSGWAFSYQTSHGGERQILDFFVNSALLGFCFGRASWYGAEAVTSCAVAVLPYPQFRQLLAKCPQLAISIADRLSESEMRAHEHLIGLGRRSARERVAALIAELMSRTQSGKSATCEGGSNLPITQIMIADALGLSNEHVCRTLGKLTEQGILEFDRHVMKVLNPYALAVAAGMDTSEIPRIASPVMAAA
jgi:CRP-like cAMP-binding protein